MGFTEQKQIPDTHVSLGFGENEMNEERIQMEKGGRREWEE